MLYRPMSVFLKESRSSRVLKRERLPKLLHRKTKAKTQILSSRRRAVRTSKTTKLSRSQISLTSR